VRLVEADALVKLPNDISTELAARDLGKRLHRLGLADNAQFNDACAIFP
jgi:hypothetical protein